MDDRNFRFGYYEKVGFGGIEERKSIEILLREQPKPPDLLNRLAFLISKYSLSPINRKDVYRLLLNVSSPSALITESRLEVQRQVAQDFIRALETMSLVDPSLGKAKYLDFSREGHPRLLVLILLFELKQLESDVNHLFSRVDVEDLLCINSYWLFKHFILLTEKHFHGLLSTYERFIQNLANEDNVLYLHLLKNDIIKKGTVKHSGHFVSSNGSAPRFTNAPPNSLFASSTSSTGPLITWFIRFFAGIIHNTHLIKMFDKLIGGMFLGHRHFDMLISVGNALIMHRRGELLTLHSFESITACILLPLSFDDSQEIIDSTSN
ncbi:TBC1 domain member 7 [Tyrophagus putrescentiae]|nr:TBC1 domain member 7 [Tyrophagus putrescentiae]